MVCWGIERGSLSEYNSFNSWHVDESMMTCDCDQRPKLNCDGGVAVNEDNGHVDDGRNGGGMNWLDQLQHGNC